jgi:hypothetical protein
VGRNATEDGEISFALRQRSQFASSEASGGRWQWVLRVLSAQADVDDERKRLQSKEHVWNLLIAVLQAPPPPPPPPTLSPSLCPCPRPLPHTLALTINCSRRWMNGG